MNVILNNDTGLSGKSLENVKKYVFSKTKIPEELARFKKKENVRLMSKSILKHRITVLTGRSIMDLETDANWERNSHNGQGFDIDVLRRYAHFLILEANNELPTFSDANEDILTDEVEMNDTFDQPPMVSLSAFKTNRRRKSDHFGMEHPPVQPKRSTRRSMVVTSSNIHLGDVDHKKVSPIKIALKSKSKIRLQNHDESVAFSLQNNLSQGWLLHGNPMDLAVDKLIKIKKDFSGFNLIVVHTPAFWMPIDVFNFIRIVKNINLTFDLKDFIMIIGCGICNVQMFKEALVKYCKEVQFLTFTILSSMNEQENELILPETTSHFLAGYFDDNTKNSLSRKFVKDKYTTSFISNDVSDLETQIIDCFTVEGDTVFDVFCGSRQLAASALRQNRSCFSIDEDKNMLNDLKVKISELSQNTFGNVISL